MIYKKTQKDETLLFQSGDIESGELCVGFRLRSTSYDRTRQSNIMRRQLIANLNHPNNQSGHHCQYQFFSPRVKF
jgi:hypothetical protein